MDSNHNFDPMTGQQSQPQQAYQPQGGYYVPPKAPSNLNVLELAGFICSAVGFVLAILGTFLSCAFSASNSVNSMSKTLRFMSGSAMIWFAIVGVVVAAAGIVLIIISTIQSKKGGKKTGIFSTVGAALAVAAIIFGMLPNLTICTYNCQVNDKVEDKVNEQYSSVANSYGDILDRFN